MELIRLFAKQQNPRINMITLDDGSFMQFPNTYTSNTDAEFIWCIAYVKNRYDSNNNKLPNLSDPYIFQPIKYSIYSVSEGFQLKVDPGQDGDVEEVQKYLDFCVGYYNTFIEKTPYDLVEKAQDLGSRQRKVQNGVIDQSLTTDIDEYRKNYNQFKEFMDTKITLFKNIKFNINRTLEDIMLYTDENDKIIGDKDFIISDYYDPKDSRNNTFKIKYNNNPNYSIEINIGKDGYFYDPKNLKSSMDMVTILDSGTEITLYNFLVFKNMMKFYKMI